MLPPSPSPTLSLPFLSRLAARIVQNACAKTHGAGNLPLLAGVRRAYAKPAPGPTTPPAGQLHVNFTVPDRRIFVKCEVKQINLSTTEGDIGVLCDHVATIKELRPGLVEFENASNNENHSYFVPGGFTVIMPESAVHVTAIDAIPLADFDKDNVLRELADSKLRLEGATDTKARAIATIEIETLESLQHVLAQQKIT